MVRQQIIPGVCCIVGLALIFSCGTLLQPTLSGPVFVIQVQHTDTAAGTAKPLLTDSVWVLVADINAYHQEEEGGAGVSFWESPVHNEYAAIRDSIQLSESGDYDVYSTKGGWVTFMRRNNLNVVSDTPLEIDVSDSTASGRVSGVAGLNWIFIGFESGGAITHFGAQTVYGSEGDVSAVQIEVNQLTGVPAVTGLEVTPEYAYVYTGETQQFTCTAFYSNNTSRDVTSEAAWSLSEGRIGTISAAGMFTADPVTTGTEYLSVSFGGATFSHTSITVETGG